MHLKTLFAIAFLGISFNPSQEGYAKTYVVPSLTRSDTDSKIMIKKNLPEATLVKHRHFWVGAPKGWSLNPVGPSDVGKSSLTLTPTSDVENDQTSVLIIALRSLSGKTLEERQAMYKKDKKTERISYQTWNNNRWLLRHFQSRDQNKKEWVAHTINKKAEYIVIARTPTSDFKRYRDPILTIMSSIILKPEIVDQLIK